MCRKDEMYIKFRSETEGKRALKDLDVDEKMY
jgi:hypothetical protein